MRLPELREVNISHMKIKNESARGGAVAEIVVRSAEPPAGREPQSDDRFRAGKEGLAQRIKKIPPELRRKKIKYSLEPRWSRRLLLRFREGPQFFRTLTQISFILLCLWIGIEFYLFYHWGLSGGQGAFHPRPPGVDGFLPIGALISLKYWLLTGIVNSIHPAGLFIFLAILGIGILLKKSFCSWLCPIGTLSESLWLLGKRIIGRNLDLPRWLDYPLRSLKYLILFFFCWTIWQMDVPDLRAFIESPYNKVADVKMYLFFAHLSGFALWTIMALIALSVLIKNFWCRYLCPYGALLGLGSLLSPLKITRSASTCIDCELCTRACPANIPVHRLNRVMSDECTSCLLCVAACPVKETLDVRTNAGDKRIPGWLFGCLVAGVFVAVTGLAMLAGRWQNAIPKEEYLQHIRRIDSPLYQHFQGKVPRYDAGEQR